MYVGKILFVHYLFKSGYGLFDSNGEKGGWWVREGMGFFLRVDCQQVKREAGLATMKMYWRSSACVRVSYLLLSSASFAQVLYFSILYILCGTGQFSRLLY